ncbi:MAG: hypothetical protein Q8P95_01605, partial [bacterium]|nr:hypothetical protein [bacterium]
MSFFSLLRSCFRSPAAMLVLMLGLTIGMGGVSGYYLAANLAGSGSTGSSSSVPSPFRATAWKHFEPVFSAIPQNPSADWCEAYSPQCRGVNIPYNAQYPGAPTSGLSSLQIWCRDFDNRCLTPLANAGLPYNLNLPVPGSTAIGPGAMGYWCENDAEPICDAYEGQRTRTPHGSYCNNYWDTCTSEPLPHPTEDPLFEEYFTQHGTVGWVPDERQTTVPPPGYIGNNVDPYLFLPLTPTTVPQSPSSDWCEAYRPQCLGVNAPVGGFPNYSGPVPQWCIDFNTRCDDHLRRAGYLGGTSLAPAFGGDPLWCTQEAHQVCAWDGLGRRRVVNNSNCNTYWNSCTSEPLPPVERDPTFAHLYPPPNTSSQSTSSSGGSSSQNSNVSTSRPEPSPELQARIDAFFANRRSASAQTSQSASGSASGQVSTDASGAGSSAQGSGATRIQIPRELLDFTAHVQSLSAGGDVQPTQDFARLNRITGLDINFE